MSTSYQFGCPALVALLVLCGCATSKAPPVVEANPRLPDPPPSAAPASESSAASGWVRVGRYSAVRPGPTAAQRDPLQAMVHVKLPGQVRTVGQAVKYTLRRSGYRLGANVGALHNREVPQVHRDLGPMTLEQALQTLAGQAYQVRPDHGARTVAFRLSPAPAAPVESSPVLTEPATPNAALAAVAPQTPRRIRSEERHSIWALAAGASQVKEQAPSAPPMPDPAAMESATSGEALASAGAPAPTPSEGRHAISALFAGAGASQVKEPAPSAPRRYGPVRSGEFLRPIAERLSAGSGLNTEQMMLALLQANPGAFGKVRGRPNVNALRCRAVLSVPDAQAEPPYSAQAASREVRRQARQWRHNPVHGGGCAA